MQSYGPIETDILLLGAGHAHVEVLRRFAMKPEPGVRLTLVGREPETPYSGMLPGLIRGDYTTDQAHIDLAPLAAAAGARLIIGEAVARIANKHPDIPWREMRGLRNRIAHSYIDVGLGIVWDTVQEGPA